MQKLDLVRLYSVKQALIVDEFPDMRASIRSMLRSFGCDQVDFCTSGAEAVIRCKDNVYDIIICDYSLGSGKNGQQVLEELRYTESIKSGAVYLMLTAETSRSMVNGAIESKPDDYLTKPFSHAALRQRLDRALVEKEYFKNVYQALDEHEYLIAVDLIDQSLQEKNVYRETASKIKGNALLKASEYKQAAVHYKALVKEAPSEWALIGYSRALSGISRWDAAQKILTDMLSKGSKNLDLYDALIEAEIELGHMDTAQNLLQDATAASPNGILRQALLGNVARENEKYGVSEQAYRKVIKLAVNSCYDSCEHSFGLIRCLIEKEQNQQGSQADTADNEGQALSECQHILNDIKYKFTGDNQVRLKADVLGVSVAARKGFFEHAAAACEAVFVRYAESDKNDAQLGFDMASAFAAVKQRDKSQAVLEDLVVRFGNKPSLMRRVDALSDTPITRDAMSNAAEINRHGKSLFENGEFAEAVDHFRRAISRYPNNNAIKLNLVLALIKHSAVEKQPKVRSEAAASAQRLLKSLEKMDEDNPAYSRYQSLCVEAKKVAQAAA
jgi:CheY-like chemotaxis protein